MMKKQMKVELLTIQHSLCDAEIIELAQRPTLDVADFCQLTESEITGSYGYDEVTYIISQAGVNHRPVDDHLLALLTPGERDVVVKQMPYRLSFPCSPAELVAFVKGADHCFYLPEEFVEAVTGVAAKKNDESPDERAIRFAKMRATGMTGAKIAKIEGGISVTQANNLCRKGEELLKRKATMATSMCGQLDPQGVATAKAKIKAI